MNRRTLIIAAVLALGWTGVCNANILRAAMTGDAAYVKQILQDYPNAIYLGHPDGRTPLAFAVSGDFIDVVEILLDNGADPNTVDDYGKSILTRAANNGNKQIADMLIAHGAKPTIQNAAAFQDIPTINRLLSANPKILDSQDGDGRTALFWAAYKGYTDVAEVLLKAGCNPNVPDNTGITPLYHNLHGRETLASMLRKFGAKLSVFDALQMSDIDTLKSVLKDSPRSANSKNAVNDTPLVAAVRIGNAEIVKVLIDAGADPNVQCGDMNTALGEALRKNRMDLVKMLIEAKADVNLISNRISPLQVAVLHKNKESIDLLESKGAVLSVAEAVRDKDIDRLRKAIAAHKDQVNEPVDGELPICRAVADQDALAVKLLLSAGADPNKKGFRDCSAMDVIASELVNNNGTAASEIRTQLEEAGGVFSIGHAIWMNDLNMIRKMIKDNPKCIRTVHPNGHSPILDVIHSKNIGILKVLVEAKADLAKDREQSQILEEAVESNDPKIISLLMKLRVDFNSVDLRGLRPLFYALVDGRTAIVDILRKNCPHLTILEAVAMRDLDEVRKILAAGPVKSQTSHHYYYSPLHLAVRNGDVEIVKALLEAGVDVNENGSEIPLTGKADRVDHMISTPLGVAVGCGYWDIVDLLLAHGADPRKDPVLHIAVIDGNVAGIKTLIAAGADVNELRQSDSVESVTPLYLAAESANIEIASLLLSQGANPDKASAITGVFESGMLKSKNMTPLHVAVRHQNLNMIKLLLDNGSNVNIRNAAGSTALDMATSGDKYSLVAKLLKERGAK